MLTLFSWLIAAPIVALNGILGAELAFGLKPRRPQPTRDGQAARTTILMPAHNEELGIAATIAALKPELNESVRLLVVADNCKDQTAMRAREAGAEVIERQNATQRGKGHALAFGRDWLRANPPDSVMVLDADCFVAPGTIANLSHAALANERPVQSCNLLRSRPDDAPMVQISNFAFLIKNKVRQRGSTRIGAPALLSGTGMAFPWTLFESAPLATSDLVEDLALGIHFAQNGHSPIFVEQALITSDPADAADTLTQRTRWEHGFVQTATRRAIPLFIEGLRQGRPGLAWLGLHLLVPPLALLVTLGGLAMALCVLLALVGAQWTPAIVCACALGAVAFLLALNWALNGREAVRGSTLARIPLYLLWKLPVYLRLVRKRESEWVRTKRAGE
ncbi:glycosyltransferase family 2 protein [Sphingobium sp. CR28]|uniref:glycosyltransferase family 2 protein n=1 Tax=Sphingobium sp. CR28 TaxID=3400272 RepID=UPI003FF06B74